MNLAISSLAWHVEEDGAIAEVLSQQSVSAIEFVPSKLWPDWMPPADSCEAASLWWCRRGLRIVSLQSILFGKPDLILFGSAEARRALLEHLGAVLQIAHRLGAQNLVFGSPKNRLAGGLSPQQALAVAVPFFRQVAERAAEFAIDLSFEPNPAAYGADFGRNTQEVLELARRVGHPRFRINLDLSTLLLNEEPIEASVASLADYLGHCHISEPHLASVGNGSVAAHRQLAAALRDVGYQKWVSIEMRNQAGSNIRSVETALEFCRDIYCRN